MNTPTLTEQIARRTVTAILISQGLVAVAVVGLLVLCAFAGLFGFSTALAERVFFGVLSVAVLVPVLTAAGSAATVRARA